MNSRDPYTWVVVIAMAFGFLVFAVIVATITYDLFAWQKGWPMVSDVAHESSRKHPAIAVLTSGVLCFAVGLLLGHLFLGRN